MVTYLKWNSSALLGIAGVAVLMGVIAVSFAISPWFSWVDNAISDFGNLNRGTAVTYNVGLLISGTLIMLYALLGMKRYAPKSHYFLAFTGFMMQVVALLCENYGKIHFNVSVVLFLALFLASVAYFWEKRHYPALIIVVAIPLWVMHFQDLIVPGAAIPELVSILGAIPWVIHSAVKVYRMN